MLFNIGRMGCRGDEPGRDWARCDAPYNGATIKYVDHDVVLDCDYDAVNHNDGARRNVNFAVYINADIYNRNMATKYISIPCGGIGDKHTADNISCVYRQCDGCRTAERSVDMRDCRTGVIRPWGAQNQYTVTGIMVSVADTSNGCD